MGDSKFCKYCGSKIEVDSKYCSSCGADVLDKEKPLKETEEIDKTQKELKVETQKEEYDKEKSSIDIATASNPKTPNKVKLVTVCSLLLLGIIVAITTINKEPRTKFDSVESMKEAIQGSWVTDYSEIIVEDNKAIYVNRDSEITSDDWEEIDFNPKKGIFSFSYGDYYISKNTGAIYECGNKDTKYEHGSLTHKRIEYYKDKDASLYYDITGLLSNGAKVTVTNNDKITLTNIKFLMRYTCKGSYESEYYTLYSLKPGETKEIEIEEEKGNISGWPRVIIEEYKS